MDPPKSHLWTSPRTTTSIICSISQQPGGSSPRLGAEANVVVVYMHAGAEGSTADHVTGNEETYVGEDRGNAEVFAHDAIDAGAALVIASGPHVLRGLQFYHGHLIAYSLGDFANYDNFSMAGDLDLSGILTVTLHADGTYVGAHFTSLLLRGTGQPMIDTSQASATFVNQLSSADFTSDAAIIQSNGQINPPPNTLSGHTGGAFSTPLEGPALPGRMPVGRPCRCWRGAD